MVELFGMIDQYGCLVWLFGKFVCDRMVVVFVLRSLLLKEGKENQVDMEESIIFIHSYLGCEFHTASLHVTS